MFLATTALSEFWDKEQDVLFLGAGCLRYDKRAEWESLDYRIMPCPWDDRRRFHEAANYLDDSYERMLGLLSQYLGSVHRVSYSQRYWRILIGPWLFHFLHVVYDRYVYLQDAFAQFPGLETIVLDQRCFTVPKDTSGLINYVCGDLYNLQIYSQVLKTLGHEFPTQASESGWTEADWEISDMRDRVEAAGKRSGKKLLRRLEGGLVRALAPRRRVALGDMYQPRYLTWKLALRTSFRAIPISPNKGWQFTMPEPEFDQRRNGLAGIGSEGEFENVFVESLPHNFPPVYLEGFHQAQAETLKRHPKSPSVVTSLVGWFYNEPFKFMAAAAAERNSRIVPAQHGGGYGVYRQSPLEKHEARIADSYMVWGWADNGSQGLRNIPSATLSTLVSNQAAKPNRLNDRPVLFMATAHPRYSFRFQSSPVGNQFADYINWELRFLEAAPESIRQALLLRPYPTDYGWDVRQRISDRFPDVRWDNGSPIHKKMMSSRLVIIDHLSTSVLETLIADIPTVLFWDPQRWEVREDAEQYFAELRSVGVLWESPEDAAAKLADVFDDPLAWWCGSELQEARRHFVDRYALGQKDWAGFWAKALREETVLSKAVAG